MGAASSTWASAATACCAPVAALPRSSVSSDIASVPGVTHLIVLEGVNDIWRATLPGEPPVGPKDLIAGYRKLIAAAHAKGIRIYGGTITPGFGWKGFTP